MADVKPLFIPLNAEFYDQFVLGTKTYELRRLKGGFNLDQVYTDRAARLSYGYGKSRPRLRSYVGNVFHSHKSIDDLLCQHDYLWQKIMPNCSGWIEMRDRCVELMGNGPFIAFELPVLGLEAD